jgi:hypothetical protein
MNPELNKEFQEAAEKYAQTAPCSSHDEEAFLAGAIHGYRRGLEDAVKYCEERNTNGWRYTQKQILSDLADEIRAMIAELEK